MNKRARKKFERAKFSAYTPNNVGGALQYVPAGMQQSVYGNTFYGNTLKNLPVGQTALFSPGAPLPTQQGVNPGGLPVQFKYPIAINTFPVDRTLQQDDIPSFEQLRRLARLDYGINLCERYWLDLVPRMKLKIGLRPEAIAQGAEEKNYRKEIGFFTDFFSMPDGEHNIHEWIQSALREQSQVDDLYIYKNRTRRGQLLGLRLVAADQMKPLLDDWGYTPAAPKFAYQQYPWGIPGALYTTDMMIHKRETPAVDDPYGMSRVERVILITNLALRKARMDLAYYTDGNVPAGLMEVPESVNWTPDQIDAYEQSWNALMAGDLQQMRRIKFVQPGMKYTPFVQPAFDSVFDRYMLNIRASVYGVPMDELGFTDSSNRSVGESQEAMVYRRTIDPFAVIYGNVFTECMKKDFSPELHGDLLCATLGGYEEVEDEQTKALALTTYTNAGILGLSAAAKLAGLPEEPGAPQIGRMMMTQSGPVWLDDVAQPDIRKAQQQATLAGYQSAASPSAPAPKKTQTPGGDNAQEPAPKDEGQGDEKAVMARVADALASINAQLHLLRAVNPLPENDSEVVSQQGSCDCPLCRSMHGQSVTDGALPPYHDGCDCTLVTRGELNEQRTQSSSEDEARRDDNAGRGTDEIARAGTQPESVRPQEGGQDRREIGAEYRRWRTRAIEDVKAGRAQRPFYSTLIPEQHHRILSGTLQRCTSVDEVKHQFEEARYFDEDTMLAMNSLERDISPKAQAASASSNGGSPQPSRSDWKLRW